MKRTFARFSVLGAFLMALPTMADAAARSIDWTGDPVSQTRDGFQFPVHVKPDAVKLIEESLSDVDPTMLRDYHTHLLALDPEKTGGGEVSPKSFAMNRWWDFLQTRIYKRAAGVTRNDIADQQYVGRLVSLIRAIPRHGKYYLLAFDRAYDEHGNVEDADGRTAFYVPNEYAVQIAKQYPDAFIPAISVHPFRPRALDELERWHNAGVRLIKWLPAAQDIPVDDPRLDDYYKKVAEYGMTILTHTGEEKAVAAPTKQAYGNPLRLRRALGFGVRIIMAHCASLGTDEDLDVPGHPRVPSYQLALRMLQEGHPGLYADISALTQRNRMGQPLLAFLKASADVQARLVNGSDYPLPAVDPLIMLGPLVSEGVLDEKDKGPLREIFSANPLLFDYVLKRRLHAPGTRVGFPAAVFMARPGVGAD